MDDFDDEQLPEELRENFNALTQELDVLRQLFIRTFYKYGSVDHAIQTIAEHGALMAPLLAQGVDPKTGPVASFFRNVARAFANHCPHPNANFAIQKVAVPQRNEPCYCGSLRKYKQCCASLPEFPTEPYLMLDELLRIMPAKQWSTLAGSAIDVHVVENLVFVWLNEGEENNIVKLLEPWFAPDRGFSEKNPIPKAYADLLNMLLDAYLRLSKPKKRIALAQLATQIGSPEIRHVGWCRIALIAMDSGDFKTMNHAVLQAQRAVPNHPHSALLEIQLLLAQQDYSLARKRATFWLNKLKHSTYDTTSVCLLLEAVIENPKTALGDSLRAGRDDLNALSDLLSNVTSTEKHYRYSTHAGEIVIDDYDAALKKAYGTWENLVNFGDPDAFWQDARYQDTLKKYPILWQSFEVLDDVYEALNEYPIDLPDVVRPLQLKIASFAVDLFIFNFGKNKQFPTKKFEWGFLQHRPALRLLSHFVMLAEAEEDAQLRELAFRVKSELVNVLNPNDNQGLRTSLVKDHIVRGELDAALKLTKKYPDDFGDMRYTSSLVLFLSKHKSADSVLEDAISKYPLIAKMLLASNPKPPKINPNYKTLGGQDEAWYYREEFLDLWQQSPGALAWLKQTSKRLSLN